MSAVLQSVREWQFPSSSSSAVYITKRHADGSLSCNCPAWRFKKADQDRSCKHTRSIDAAPNIAAMRKPVKAQPLNPRIAERAALQQPAEVAGPIPGVPSPMLASAMVVPVTGAEFDRAYAGWLMEEKHDGHRIAARVTKAGQVMAWARPQDGAANVKTLPENMVGALRHLNPGVYDGELVSPGGNSWDVTVIGARLVFVIFDLIEIDGRDISGLQYVQRREMLIEQLRNLPEGQKSVSTVESLPVSWATVEKIWQRGGEGVIVKRPQSSYRAGYRSPDWIKVKAKRAATLTIIGFEAGKCGPYSKLKIRDDSGHETTCKTLGNAMLADITRNPESFIGRRVVISYQQKTPGGSYRHGIFDHFAGEGE